MEAINHPEMLIKKSSKSKNFLRKAKKRRFLAKNESLRTKKVYQIIRISGSGYQEIRVPGIYYLYLLA
jgi:hypothetical protein